MNPYILDIRNVARMDPILAYGMVIGIPLVPLAMNCTGTFASFAPNQAPVEGDLDTTIATRTWMDRCDYAVAQPNVFFGNVQKTAYDAYLRQSPGVSVKVTVHSGPRYLMGPQFTPLENFTNNIIDGWTKGWIMFKQQSIKVEFLLTGNFPSTAPNQPPYTVVMTFTGWQFLDMSIDNMTPEMAVAELVKRNILPGPAAK